MSKNSARGVRRERAAGARTPAEAGTAAETHRARLQTCLRAIDTASIVAVAERLRRIAASGGLILIAGNGGSAATASHMALDLAKGRLPGQEALRVRTISLADPSPVLTAWANDAGYEGVFAEQISTLAGRSDGVVLLSVSGTSPNIVAAARAARTVGATVVALTGARGHGMRRLADLAVVVPSDDYRVVEDVHLAISHMITAYLSEALRRAKTAGTRRSGRMR